ncbi:MAG TPA: nuclear transport factor 2 family protein [Rhizomicrobium sp.]|jgi:hypothetical protein
MSEAQRAVEAYFAAWNEKDPARISALVKSCIAADAQLTSSAHSVTGADALAEFIVAFRQMRPGDAAVLTSKVESVGAVFRFTGCGKQPDGTVYSDVMDVGELDADGRIKRLVTFDSVMPSSS